MRGGHDGDYTGGDAGEDWVRYVNGGGVGVVNNGAGDGGEVTIYVDHLISLLGSDTVVYDWNATQVLHGRFGYRTLHTINPDIVGYMLSGHLVIRGGSLAWEMPPAMIPVDVSCGRSDDDISCCSPVYLAASY